MFGQCIYAGMINIPLSNLLHFEAASLWSIVRNPPEFTSEARATTQSYMQGT
jgi:hypothetical protein